MSAELAQELRTFAQWWAENSQNTETIYKLQRKEGTVQLTVQGLRAAADALDAAAAPADASADYERFMSEWKQVGVWQGGKPVRTKLARLAKARKLDEVWAGLERLRNDPNRPAAEFVPRPMTWLNQERWNDDPYPVRSGGRQAAAGAVLGLDLSQAEMHIQQIESAPLHAVRPSISDELKRGQW